MLSKAWAEALSKAQAEVLQGSGRSAPRLRPKCSKAQAEVLSKAWAEVLSKAQAEVLQGSGRSLGLGTAGSRVKGCGQGSRANVLQTLGYR